MKINLTYDYLTRHLVPGPQSFSYFVPHILLPLALLTPRSVLSRWQNAALFLPVMVVATIHAWTKIGGVDVISMNTLLGALLLLLLKDPWKDFRRILRRKSAKQDHEPTETETDSDAGSTGLPTAYPQGAEEQEQAPLLTSGSQTTKISPEVTVQSLDSYHEQSYPSRLFQRLPWVGMLLVSIRFNDWLISSPTHDRYQPPPPAFEKRTRFIAQAMLSFVRGFLTLDLTRAYIEHDQYFTDPSVSLFSALPFGDHSGVAAALIRVLVVGAQAWALISQLFYIFATIPVLLNGIGLVPDIWSPHNWASYYGPASAIFTSGVRGFWGTYWHQTMRRSVSGPGYAIADILKLRSGGLARYAIVSIVAFVLSGTVHTGLVPPQPLHATVSPNTIRLCILNFFAVQPLAMLIELLVQRLVASTTGLERWQSGNGLRARLALNGVWVVLWFCLCLPLVGETGRQLGWWRVWPLPVSLWNGLHGKGWIVWPFLLE